MSTTETTGGTGGTGAARIRPAQEAVAPPSPSPERGVAQPTASPEARTAWPSVPLTSPAVNRPPGDTSARINVRDAVVPDPSPSSPPVEASPAARVDQPGPPRAATPALVREPSLTDLAHPVSASSDGPPSAIRSSATRILVASADADTNVSTPAKGDTSVPAALPGDPALHAPDHTRVRIASPEPDAPAETDAPVIRRRVSEEPLRTAATDTHDNGHPAQDVPVTAAVSPPPVAVFTAVDKTTGEEATPPAGEPARVKPATIPPDVPADAVGGMGDSGGRGNIDTPLAAGFPDPDDESRHEGQSAAAKVAAANQPTAGAAVAGEPTREGHPSTETRVIRADTLTPTQAITKLIMVPNQYPTNDDPQNTEPRILRRRKVRGRLLELGNFLQSIEGKPPESLEEAFERHERLLGLLVHPTVEEILTENIGALHLPENTALCVVGSSGNGTAQVRTLAGTDQGFDFFRTGNGKPDIDTYLISEASLSYDTGTKVYSTFKDLLDRHNIRLDSIFNPGKYRQSLEVAERNMRGRTQESLYQLRWIFPIFYPGFPKVTASKMRLDIIDKLTNLGAVNPQRHQQVIEFLKAEQRDFAFPLSGRYLNNQMQTDLIDAVRVTLGTRIVGILNELLDMTYPQDNVG